VKIRIRVDEEPTLFGSDSINITRISAPRGLTRTQTPLFNKNYIPSYRQDPKPSSAISAYLQTALIYVLTLDQCSQTFCFRILTFLLTSVECLGDKCSNLKIYISELILDNYEYAPLPYVTMHCIILPSLNQLPLATWVQGVSY
jgi:hypothetical protein